MVATVGVYIHASGQWPPEKQGDEFRCHCNKPGITAINDDEGWHLGIYSIEVYLKNI